MFTKLVIDAPRDVSAALDGIPLLGLLTQDNCDRFRMAFIAAFDVPRLETEIRLGLFTLLDTIFYIPP